MIEDQIATKYIEQYEKAKVKRENIVTLLEECYEYAPPPAESY